MQFLTEVKKFKLAMQQSGNPLLKIVLRKNRCPMCIQPFCIFVQKSESYFPRIIKVLK